MGAVADALVRILDDADDDLSVREVMAELRATAARVPRGQVERALAGDDRFVEADLPGRWRLDQQQVQRGPVRVDHDAIGAPAALGGDGGPLAGLGLRDWQVAAFGAWAGAGCRGVVEAVTGTGKTRLAIAAVRVVLGRGGRALVLAPTLDLVEQWAKQLREHVPDARIGRLGGGHDDDLFDHHVLVATPHSAADVDVDLPPGDGPGGSCLGLLVADEAHRYGAPTWGAALRDRFTMRLALTATYERNDDGIADVLGPYFGGICFGYDFAAAARDRVIAPFHVTFVGTGLDPTERQSYDQADRRSKEWYRTLTGSHGLSRDPRRAIAEASAIIAQAGGGSAADKAKVNGCKAWLAAMRERRDVAAQAAGKLEIVRHLTPALAGRRTLLFSDTVDQAELACRMITGPRDARTGIAAEEIHGGLPKDKRRIRLAQFANGNLDVIAAPRVLDEGVDVPDADLAVALASFRTRRQMIQRLGRVLRLKDDGRCAHLVITYATDTREDPANGGHRAFADEITDVARSVATLDADDRGFADAFGARLTLV